VGKQRVQRLMQQHGIRARGKRRFRITTTDSGHHLPIAPNLLNRNFTPVAPNQTWVGDITYIASDEGWLFLAVVIDLFFRPSRISDVRTNPLFACVVVSSGAAQAPLPAFRIQLKDAGAASIRTGSPIGN
jgi:hypothetical protein